jgi:hypothetical protein
MLSEWMRRNLEVQGYCLTEQEGARLRVGLRFSTGLSLPLFVTGLALGSAPIIFGLAAVGAVAGLTPRHPFDLLWNHGVRHLTGGPELPPNPRRRRHAFKVGTLGLLTVGVLLTAGIDGVALALGIGLLAAGSLVTVLNFCIPSTVLLWLERRHGSTPVTT